MSIDPKEKLKDWLTCERCDLHKTRRQVVLGRGVMPAEILFIGEAPGKSEDLVGEAFVGRSGRLLDSALADAAKMACRAAMPTYYISNVVACIPYEDGTMDTRAPSRQEELACWKRLDLTARLVSPDHIILLGAVAANAVGSRFPAAMKLRHPAYILRQGGTASTEYRTFVRELADLFRKMSSANARTLAPQDLFGDKVKRVPQRGTPPGKVQP